MQAGLTISLSSMSSMNHNYIDEIDLIEREAEMEEVLNNFDLTSQNENDLQMGEVFLKEDLFGDNLSEVVTTCMILSFDSLFTITYEL